MEQYVTELSKYGIALLFALYAYEGFAVFRFARERERNGIYIRQNILMFLVHFLCYSSLILRSGKIEYLFFFLFQQLALFTMIVLFQLLYPGANRLLINNMCMLLAVGFVILTRISYEKAVRQFLIVICSMAVSLFVPLLLKKIPDLPRLKWLYAGCGAAALAAVLFAGAVTNGSRLAFSVFGISVQPSEFVKIVYIFALAAILSESERFSRIVLSAAVAAAHILILVCSRDLGGALIYFVAYIILLYCATGKVRYPLLGLLAGAAASVAAYFLFSHVRVRVQAWKDPWSVIDGEGYQITQSLFAIGCGNWFGLGIGQGSPQSIPFVETDFVFSAIAEELGVIFAVCLILVCVACFLMFMKLAMDLTDRFCRYAVLGLGVTYLFQIFLTIGGGTKFIPLTGVTLPFISYGGSSVLATFLTFTAAEGLFLLQEAPEDRPQSGTPQNRASAPRRQRPQGGEPASGGRPPQGRGTPQGSREMPQGGSGTRGRNAPQGRKRPQSGEPPQSAERPQGREAPQGSREMPPGGSGTRDRNAPHDGRTPSGGRIPSGGRASQNRVVPQNRRPPQESGVPQDRRPAQGSGVPQGRRPAQDRGTPPPRR